MCERAHERRSKARARGRGIISSRLFVLISTEPDAGLHQGPEDHDLS